MSKAECRSRRACVPLGMKLDSGYFREIEKKIISAEIPNGRYNRDVFFLGNPTRGIILFRRPDLAVSEREAGLF